MMRPSGTATAPTGTSPRRAACSASRSKPWLNCDRGGQRLSFLGSHDGDEDERGERLAWLSYDQRKGRAVSRYVLNRSPSLRRVLGERLALFLFQQKYERAAVLDETIFGGKSRAHSTSAQSPILGTEHPAAPSRSAQRLRGPPEERFALNVGLELRCQIRGRAREYLGTATTV